MDDPQFNTEGRILEAAEREFIKKGFAGARTTDIARGAGVTHAMLHYYYRTKENLFEKVLERKVGTIRYLILASIGDPERPLFEKIEDCIRTHYDFVANNPDLPFFLTSELHTDPTRMKPMIEMMGKLFPRVIKSLQEQINAYAAEGKCRQMNAKMLILDILSLNIYPTLIHTMVSRFISSGGSESMDFMEMRKQSNVETILSKLRP